MKQEKKSIHLVFLSITGVVAVVVVVVVVVVVFGSSHKKCSKECVIALKYVS